MGLPSTQLMQYVRVPPEVRRLRGHASRLVPSGLFAIVAGSLAAVAYVKRWDDLQNYNRVYAGMAVAACVVGGALALVKQSIGAPIAGGGGCVFIMEASALVGGEISFGGAFDTLEAKLMLAAGIAGLLTAMLALSGLAGMGNAAIGAIIALLGFVVPAATAALNYIDKTHLATQIAPIVAATVVAVLMAVGGVRGRVGSLLPMTAAACMLPLWIEAVRTVEQREAAAIAGMVALIAIVALGAIVLLLAARLDQDGVTGGAYEGTGAVPAPDVLAETPPPGPDAGSASRPPIAAMAVRRVGPVVPPATTPSVPEPSPVALGRWAPDPYGRHQVRYWNGTRWTDHVANDGIVALDGVPQL